MCTGAPAARLRAPRLALPAAAASGGPASAGGVAGASSTETASTSGATGVGAALGAPPAAAAAPRRPRPRPRTGPAPGARRTPLAARWGWPGSARSPLRLRLRAEPREVERERGGASPASSQGHASSLPARPPARSQTRKLGASLPGCRVRLVLRYKAEGGQGVTT